MHCPRPHRRRSTAARLLRSHCHDVCCEYVCGYVCWHDKTKTPDRNDFKLGTVVVLNTMSKPDFGLKRSGLGSGLGLLSADQK